VTAQFTFLSGARTGEVEVLRKSYIGLGRHPLSDVRFDADRDLDVSSRHAAVVRKADGYYLQDLGSTNGTLLNGQRVSREVRLADGDMIRCGANGPTVEFRLLPVEVEPDLSGPEALARRISRPREELAAVPSSPRPPRSSTALRIASEVARQTRSLRRTTKVLVATLVLVAVFGGLQLAGARARGRELAVLQARADSLVRETADLAERLAGELSVVRRALAHAEAETARLRGELAASDGDATTLVRLRAELEAAELRQRGLIGVAGVDYRTIARRNQDAVAMVLVEFSDTERHSGTAFAVDSQGTLVTNKHVLVGERGDRVPRRLGVMFAGSRQNFPAHVIALAPEADIAVLRVTVRGGVPRVAGILSQSHSVERGDPVAILGYPLGFDLPMARSGEARVPVPTLTVGTVSKVLPDVVQLDGYGAPGSSGSPVFDRNGLVAGVVYGGERESLGKIVYAVPGPLIAEYLRTLGLHSASR
jgi:pSer/pThr/pTyr-binding forkhead associated (FHA) protein/S1-C subfamily serine protease